jgi:hypothetical protein
MNAFGVDQCSMKRSVVKTPQIAAKPHEGALVAHK